MTVSTEQAYSTAAPQRGAWHRLADWARRARVERRASLLLLAAALLSVLATFGALTGRIASASDPGSVLLLLTLNLALLLCFSALVARRLVILWMARRRETAGARLHARLVGLFGLVAITPALILAVFSVLFFEFGLQGWFSKRVSTAVKESLAVAQLYLQEHRHIINADALAMAHDLNRVGPQATFNSQRFRQFVTGQAMLRALTEAMIFDRSGRVLAKAGQGDLLDFDPQIPPSALDQADEGGVVIVAAESENRVRALLKLQAFEDTYLLVGRPVDPRALAHMERSSDAVRLYEQLEGKRSGLILTFVLVFILISLLLLLAATWVGLAFAGRLSRPIGHLIAASERVAEGDLTVQVKNFDERDEIGNLARAFNRMTGELERQQGELIETNQQIEERRRFIEAVLSGVSAGVIGLDETGMVSLPNRSACELLALSPAQMKECRLSDHLPDVEELLEKARRRPGRVFEQQMSLPRPDEPPRTLLVRVVAERDERAVIGFVVTFDDVSELLAAQRKAAWADVARRIAHEIKNPLTPIQLSAERLKRKYLPQVTEDKETFQACTDTIVRQVTDIGRMVTEFSSFARMPMPVMSHQDLRRLVEEALTLQQTAHGDIQFESALPDRMVPVFVDPGQVRQALTNLLQNAVESVEARVLDEQARQASPTPGRVGISLRERESEVLIEIEDNGRGLPRELSDRLTEPYVTTRERGTGLGLAIVKKIMEDHGGDLQLRDRAEGGARASLVFPYAEERPGEAPSALDRPGRTRAAHGA